MPRLPEGLLEERARPRGALHLAELHRRRRDLDHRRDRQLAGAGQTRLAQRDALFDQRRLDALQVGQRTVVKVAAFDHTVYGTLDGRISEISADSLSDERGERYFRAVVTVDGAALQAFGQPVTPGMTVNAGAVTGQRTILQALLSPIRGMAGNALREHR